MIPDVLRRELAAPRDLAPAGLPVRVEAPQQPDERDEAALDHHHLRVREALEDPVAEDRDEVPVHAAPAERVVLDVEVGVARGGDRAGDADALVVGVHDHGQRELVGGLPDRVVHRIAVGDARSAGQEDAHELVAPADAPDLLRRLRGVLRRDRDQPAQPRLGLEVVLEQPVVVRARELGRDHGVRHDAEAAADRVGRRDAERHVVRVEHLRLHLREVDRCACPDRSSAGRRRPCAPSPSGGTRGSRAARSPCVPECSSRSRVAESV